MKFNVSAGKGVVEYETEAIGGITKVIDSFVNKTQMNGGRVTKLVSFSEADAIGLNAMLCRTDNRDAELVEALRCDISGHVEHIAAMKQSHAASLRRLRTQLKEIHNHVIPTPATIEQGSLITKHHNA